ncbi:MAG: 50S ribosomal protein L25 [Solirubrobacteraceae bacterium]
MSEQSTNLLANRREPAGSRGARRLRREGKIPGTVYGGGKDPVSLQIDARVLRNTLANASALINLQIDGAPAEPVVLKERVRHPVSGYTVHIDLLRVDLNKPIQTQVALELIDIEESDIKGGGVLENPVREVTLEAVPTMIPDVIQHSVAGLAVGGQVTLGEIVAPEGTTIIGDPDLVIAAIRTSRGMMAAGGQPESEIELETEVVGDGGTRADGKTADAE